MAWVLHCVPIVNWPLLYVCRASRTNLKFTSVILIHVCREAYAEGSLESLSECLQSGLWTNRGDGVWRVSQAMDRII